MGKTLIFIETDSVNKDDILKAIGKLQKTNTETTIVDTNYGNADAKLLELLYTVASSVLYKQPNAEALTEDDDLYDIYSNLNDLVSQLEDYQNK